MDGVSLRMVYGLLTPYPELLETVTLEKALQFIRLADSLKRDILFGQKPSHNPENPPETLPDNVHSFLSSALGYPDLYIGGLWTAFRSTIWDLDHHPKVQADADRKLFYDNQESKLSKSSM